MNLLGDGYCDDQANTEQCFYDFGDCCDYTDYQTSRSLCTECFCYADNLQIPSLASKLSQLVSQCEDIIIEVSQWVGLGDGQCDSGMNNIDFFFDAGDCCYDSNEDSANQCYQSNAFCNQNTLGDGLCQDYNNGPFCDYDLGDCCVTKKNTSECCICLCVHQDYVIDEFAYVG